MSDIGTARTATVTCARCGARNDLSRETCDACGAPLPGPDGDRGRDALEIQEVWRAVAAAGFDNDVEVGDGRARCPVCGTEVPVRDIPLGEARAAVDTATRRDDLLVAPYRCRECHSGLRAVLTPEVRADSGAAAAPASSARTGPPATPVEAEPEKFEPGGPGTLEDQRDLSDDEGEDRRLYTGEPVETDQGWVIPEQQNAGGRDNIAGSGEWPDPDTPPVQPG